MMGKCGGRGGRCQDNSCKIEVLLVNVQCKSLSGQECFWFQAVLRDVSPLKLSNSMFTPAPELAQQLVCIQIFLFNASQSLLGHLQGYSIQVLLQLDRVSWAWDGTRRGTGTHEQGWSEAQRVHPEACYSSVNVRFPCRDQNIYFRRERCNSYQIAGLGVFTGSFNPG